LIQPVSRSARPQRFVVMAGVGFDAAMVRDAPESLKAWMGWMAYLTSAAKHLRGHSMHVRVSIDDGPEIHARARTVMIGNFGTLPGGLDLLLDARPDDGKLDVGIIACHSLLDWLRVGSRVITRRADVDNRYLTYQGKRIQVRLNASQPRQIDGDLIGAARRLDVEVEPAALLVRVPVDPTSPPPKGIVMRESS
jgi:diacylglycerol kinase family enzyme